MSEGRAPVSVTGLSDERPVGMSGMLSDSDIKRELSAGEAANLKIIHADNESITPVGYDVRAGETVFSSGRRKVFSLDHGEFTLKPGDTAFVTSMEEFQLSNRIGGIGLSRLEPQLHGVVCPSLPVDPTWRGKLLIILTNTGKEPFVVSHGDRMMTVVFFYMCNQAEGQIERKRWDNDNIRTRFREIEAEAKARWRNGIVLDAVVLGAWFGLLKTLEARGYLASGNEVLTSLTAGSALYLALRYRR